MTGFLKDRCRIAAGRAHRAVARSRVLGAARTTLAAWTSGRLSTDQVMILLDQAMAVPDQFAEAEAELPGIVEDLTVTDTSSCPRLLASVGGRARHRTQGGGRRR